MPVVDDTACKKAGEVLRAGGVAIFPTDTVYGIGQAVLQNFAPSKIYAIKHRDANKPIPWLVSGVDALDIYGKDVPRAAYVLARTFWPGALTLIVPVSHTVPAAFAGEDNTVALRMPDDVWAQKILSYTGVPVATSSANIQGHTPPARLVDVEDQVSSAADYLCGDNDARSGVSSTIVSFTSGDPKIVRVGEISPEEIEKTLQGI